MSYIAGDNQWLVRHWHRLFGYLVSDVPTVPGWEDLMVRDALIAEEVGELRHELGRARPDLVKIAHEAADLAYVLYGLAVECGFDLDDCIAEVHEANMSKSIHPSGGKAIKGEHFHAADIAGVLNG